MTTLTLEQSPPAWEGRSQSRAIQIELPSNSASSKSGRKQHRSCDQCRKGKRRCDAAIVDDVEFSGTSGAEPASRRGSCPLGPCSNCTKTGKECTFVWLRSMQNERTSRTGDGFGRSLKRPKLGTQTLQTENPGLNNVLPEQARDHLNFLSISSPDVSSPVWTASQRDYEGIQDESHLSDSHDDFSSGHYWNAQAPETDQLNERNRSQSSAWNGSVTGSEAVGSAFSEELNNSTNSSLFSISELPRTQRQPAEHVAKHKRRHASRPAEMSNFSTLENLANFTNKSLMTENLMKVYHDSLENALSCWLTERTCPYGNDTAPSNLTLSVDASMLQEWGPKWSNRICSQVFNLDRVSTDIHENPLTKDEDRAASKALSLAIMAFATQWSQSSERSRAKYNPDAPKPFANREGRPDEPDIGRNLTPVMEFDRIVQESLWSQARRAIQDATHIESFRVVFAHLIFALTQKPLSVKKYLSPRKTRGRKPSPTVPHADLPSDAQGYCYRQKPDASASRKEPFEDHSRLMDELEGVIHQDGPPVFLEQGLRHIHSLRYKLNRLKRTPKNGHAMAGSPPKSSPIAKLSQQDWKTVDLLYWLGIMFDTLSSAMHTRPLVISDEDSDVRPDKPYSSSDRLPDSHFEAKRSIDGRYVQGSMYPLTTGASNLWTSFFFEAQRPRGLSSPIRWPCSYEVAATTLADAAPIKVLLFRKVTRIQTLLSRNADREELEGATEDALIVYRYWNMVYGPFIMDCIVHHDQLPVRIQSWYICLTGHWQLAVLLLADIIEGYESQPGLEIRLRDHQLPGLVASLRQSSTQAVAALAKCSCPRENASFPTAGNFHFAVNEGALLTEPWTQVLIRVFAKAGALLLAEAVSKDYSVGSGRKALQHSEECVEALFYLGRKSDMAFLAAEVLARALKNPLEKLRTSPTQDLEDWLECGFSANGDIYFPDPTPASSAAQRAAEAEFNSLVSDHGAALTDFDILEPFV